LRRRACDAAAILCFENVTVSFCRKPGFPTLLFASCALIAAFSPVGSDRVPSHKTASGSQFAVPSPPHYTTFTVRDGLAGNIVTSVALAQGGAVWAGTTTGATRIEPGSWTTFTHLHGLGDDWITGIAIGPDQRVWFGTQSGGLSVFDGARFTTYDLSNSGIPSNFVTAIAIRSDGVLWVGTLNAGAASFDPTANRWKVYRLPDNSVTSMALDANGSVWLGTDGGGAYHFDGTHWQHADVPGSGQVTKLENRPDGGLAITTLDGMFRLEGQAWIKVQVPQDRAQAARALSLQVDQIAASADDGHGNVYFATPRGLVVSTTGPAEPPVAVKPLPVVLVHGWTVSARDDLLDSEFRFLQQYASEDGIPVFYAQGVSPNNTLFGNAEHLRDDIAAIKKETGAEKVNLLAFSMGGLNARAYLESSNYAHDVNRVIILGTPEAGVELWKPVLAQQIVQKPYEPSAIELTPEYSGLFNETHTPRTGVPYDLLIGDARKQPGLEFIADMPANDGLIGVTSAVSLAGANVRHTVDADLHAYDPTAVPIHLTSYLYPRDTYDRYLRNAFRDPTNAPLGSEIESPPPAQPPAGEPPISSARNHTPPVSAPIAAGQTVTRTVTVDANTHARFLAYFPGGDMAFSIRGPDGRSYNSNDGSVLQQASGSSSGGAIALKADIASFVGFSIPRALPGKWALILTRKDKGSAPLAVTTYVDLDANQRLSAGVNRDIVDLGNSITITATLKTTVSNVNVSAQIAVPAAHPGGAFSFAEVPLADDGRGSYSATYTPQRSGYYLVFLNAVGADFARGTEFLFAVNPGGARVTAVPETRIVRDDSGQIKSLTFEVSVESQRAGKFAVGAILRNSAGAAVARSTFPAELSPGGNQVTVTFQASDLAAPPPYSLDLALLDTSWAAIQVGEANNAAIIQR
jgi:pimeloyl-ACP methyl ester carboxylesterase